MLAEVRRWSPTPTPLLSVSVMLDKLGDMFSEPGWLQVAYSLLSQMTHTTALGLFHLARLWRGQLRGGELSSEMTALSLDIECVPGARILGTAGLILRNLHDDAGRWRDELLRLVRGVQLVRRIEHGAISACEPSCGPFPSRRR